MRQILDDDAAFKRKQKTFAKLVERYHMKKALLESWLQNPNADPSYLRDLKRRVRICENDITYRGGDLNDARM